MAGAVRGQDRKRQVAAWCLCLIAGLAIGVSGFSSESNHPTYLPPGLRYFDPSFLADDWWLNSSDQYHFAFFALTAALARIGVLEIGLAALNVLAVAGGLYAAHRIIVWLRASNPLACFALLVGAFLATSTFFSIGSTFLFMPSLQPSSIAAAATLWALLAFLEGRGIRCGWWLAAAGLFHLNYLVANVPLFGTAYVLRSMMTDGPRGFLARKSLTGLLPILGPTALLIAIFLPVLLTVEGDALNARDAALADWIFFRFAVSFHYYPLDWLHKLPVLAGWQALGLLWTVRAVPDPSQRAAIWSLQLAFVLVLWTAIALTTLVFVPFVARLLLWRLAPFAVLLAVLLTIVGGVRLLAQPRPSGSAWRRDGLALFASIAIPILLLPLAPRPDQLEAVGGYPPMPIVLAPFFALLALRLWTQIALPNGRVAVAALAAVIGLAAASLPAVDGHSRYALLPGQASKSDKGELFDFARRSTPPDAQFLVPPTLDLFRLQAERAIVVDFKAMPVDRAGLIAWYRRLADVSGTHHPASMEAVQRGYDSLDRNRLETLRIRYRLTHVVLAAGYQPALPNWREIYRNREFRVLAYAGR